MAKRLFNLVIHPAMKDAIETIKERDGISESEQVRRAIAAWIESKGIKMKGEAEEESVEKRDARVLEARRLGVSPATAHRWLRRVSPTP
jgi:hypothetical protein